MNNYNRVDTGQGSEMLAARLEKATNGKTILRLKGRLGASSAIYMGTLLEEAFNRGITNLTMDFSEVSDFDYTGVVLSIAVLDFYGRDFSQITCYGLPQNIETILKALVARGTSGLRIVPADDSKGLGVSADISHAP
jgi:ABC-type transporter Mla MlaB component